MIKRPKGHKRGCACVICARQRPRRKNSARPSKQNAGYENQQLQNLREEAKTLRGKVAKNRRGVRRNSAVRIPRAGFEVTENPVFRGSAKSRPAVRWYILDLYASNGAKISTRIRQQKPSGDEVRSMLGRRLNHHNVRKIELSGPYSQKPTAKTARK